MKAGWRFTPLGEVVKLNYGKAIAKEVRGPVGPVPVYGANGVMDYCENMLSKGPSIIIGRKGSAGAINVADGPFWASDVSYFTEHDPLQVDFFYLLYFLKQLDLPSLAKGVKPGINRDEVYALPISLPSLDEQKRIVAVLDEAFEGLSRARANAEANLADARELFAVTLATLMAPHDAWTAAPLAQHVKFVDYRGKTPPKREQGVRLITAKNVKMGFVQRTPEEYVDPAAYDDWMTRGLPKRGDVLFTTEAPLANVAQLDTDEKVMIGQRLITMQPNPQIIDGAYLKFQLMSTQVQKSIRLKATGATVTGIKASLLKLVQVRFPANVADQLEIAEKCEAAFQDTKQVERHYADAMERLASLRQSLLQKAFSGDLT